LPVGLMISRRNEAALGNASQVKLTRPTAFKVLPCNGNNSLNLGSFARAGSSVGEGTGVELVLVEPLCPVTFRKAVRKIAPVPARAPL
jgi:hypothetical protein